MVIDDGASCEAVGTRPKKAAYVQLSLIWDNFSQTQSNLNFPCDCALQMQANDRKIRSERKGYLINLST